MRAISAEINKDNPSVSAIKNAISRATNILSGGLGGNVVINTNADGQPVEILAMNTADITTAMFILRINRDGISVSSTGYTGPFVTVMELDGDIAAGFIKVVWNNSTVKSILTNEKYKGCALLQKGYTAGFLTKKRVKNDGAVPQYYVEDSHPAIIEPEVFDRVQDLIEVRSKTKGYSGCTIFSAKIKCGCCGEWYGSKVWHSTDKYRRAIWRCNAKYRDKKSKCPTPHLTEDEIKAAFIRMVNKLSAERGTILSDLREIQQTYSGTDDLKRTLRELNLRLNREADAVQDLIAENARVAQDQEAYNAKYDELVASYEATKERRDRVAAEIRQKGIRRREFSRFITALENLPEEVTEFEEAMWSSLVEHMVVYAKDDIRFILPCGTEIRI